MHAYTVTLYDYLLTLIMASSTQRQGQGKKMGLTWFILVDMLIVIALIVGIQFMHTDQQPTNTGSGLIVPQQVTLEGVYTCLPHRDTTGPQTMECALGMQATTNRFYALDLSSIPASQKMGLATGSGVRVQGLMTPVEMLNSDQWQKYYIVGIIKADTLSAK